MVTLFYSIAYTFLTLYMIFRVYLEVKYIWLDPLYHVQEKIINVIGFEPVTCLACAWWMPNSIHMYIYYNTLNRFTLGRFSIELSRGLNNSNTSDHITSIKAQNFSVEQFKTTHCAYVHQEHLDALRSNILEILRCPQNFHIFGPSWYYLYSMKDVCLFPVLFES